MTLRRPIQSALVGLFLGAMLALPICAKAQGGGDDFTRVVSSSLVNGHWLVRLKFPKGIVTGDFTHAKMGKVVSGKVVIIGRQEAMSLMVPGATLRVRHGEPNAQGIIAILIGLFVDH